MSRRRRRKKTATDNTVKRDKISAMGSPNNLVPKVREGHGWPMMKLKMPDGDAMCGVFVDPIHGFKEPYEWETQPPSWIDPEVFAIFALRSDDVKNVCNEIVESGSKSDVKKLSPVLMDVLKKQYFRWAMAKFIKSQDVISEYIAARYAKRIENAKEDAEIKKYEATNKES